ncbi:hypothetical protein VIGAN_07158300, partial [Vigna angularis var. angularis]
MNHIVTPESLDIHFITVNPTHLIHSHKSLHSIYFPNLARNSIQEKMNLKSNICIILFGRALFTEHSGRTLLNEHYLPTTRPNTIWTYVRYQSTGRTL